MAPSDGGVVRVDSIVKFKQRGTYDLTVREAVTRPDTKFRVAAGEVGVVTEVLHKTATVRLHESNRLVSVPCGQLEVSPRSGDVWDVRYETPNLGNNAVTIPSRPEQTAHMQALTRHIFAYLNGVAEERGRIRDIDSYLKQLRSFEDRERTAGSMVKNIIPTVRAVLTNMDFTIDDLVNAAPEFANSVRGVYDDSQYRGIYAMVFYGPFKQGSGFKPDGVYLYIGQSIRIAMRIKGHMTAAVNTANPSYMSERSQCHRAASRWVAVRILEQSNWSEGGNEHSAGKLLDIYEQTLFVLTRSYHPKTFEQSIITHKNDARSLEQRVDVVWKHVEMSVLHNRTGTAASKATGYGDPQRPLGQGRAKAFGVTGGLNVSSPLGSENRDQYEATVWGMTRLLRERRTIFHRPGIAVTGHQGTGSAAKYRYLRHAQMSYRMNGANYYYAVETTAGQPGWPDEGDMVYLTFEIMDEGEVHPAPYIPLQTVSCWTNHTQVLRIGCKLIWRSEKSKGWFMRYMKANYSTYIPGDDHVPGSTKGYALGSGLLAFFARCSWPNASSQQTFLYDFGHANIVEVNIDAYLRKVVCRPITRQLWRLQGPTYSREQSVIALQNLRAYDASGNPRIEHIQNINGTKDGLDKSWITEDRVKDFLTAQHGKEGGKTAGALKRRDRCDDCQLSVMSKDYPNQVRMVTAGCKDYKPGTDQQGNRYTWCKFVWQGPTMEKKKSGQGLANQRTCDGPLYNAFKAATHEQPTNKEAYACHQIPDPGFYKIIGKDAGDVDAADEAEEMAEREG